LTHSRRFQHLALLLGLPLFVLLMVGCTGQLGVAWAGLTVLDETTQIVYAHEDTLVIIDVADQGTVLALRDEEGNRIVDSEGNAAEWRVRGRDLDNIDNAQFFASPLQLTDNVLLVPVSDGSLVEFDLTTATPISIASAPVQERGNVVTNPLQVGEVVLLGLQERLLALDAETLQERWSVATEHAVWSQPTVADGNAYFVSLDHNMYAVVIESGELLWRLDLGGAAAGTPAYNPETNQLYIGTFSNEILAVDAAEGAIVNTFETTEWVWGSPVLIEEDAGLMLYTADLGGTVYKLEANTLSLGEVGWQIQAAEGAIRTTPVVFNESVVVGSRDQNVYWLDRETGEVEETRSLDGEVLSEILYFSAEAFDDLEQDMVVVSTLSNRDALVGFEAETAERIWTFRR
jgi:outer membrane protein assembly factor BamB